MAVLIRSLLLAVALWCLATPARAQIPARSDIYRYQALNRDLVDVLRVFAADQRLNIVIDPEVGQQTINETIELPPEQFLDYVTGKYGLSWYYDGMSLYVDRGGNMQTRLFPLRFTTPTRVIEAMRELNAYSERFRFRVMQAENVILVVGPPRLVQMTELVVGTLETGGQATAAAGVSIGVFPLKYASAGDQTFTFQGSSVVVPGVASILQGIVTGQAIPGDVSAFVPRSLPGLTGYGLNRYSPQPLPQPNPQSADFPPRSQVPNGPPVNPEYEAQQRAAERWEAQNPGNNTTAQIQPTIVADKRLNAVVVRDIPERMASYETVIQSLDKPSGLVEITAKIIDVSERGVFEWGLPYDVQWNRDGTAQELSVQLTATDSANLAVTLLRDQATEFMQRIKALEQDGYARVASRPSLLTMDNVEAQIDNSETFFVRVEGDFEVELFDVSVGTTLKIVPHIIEQDGQMLVKLSVQVNDGAVLEQTVDEIPRIRNDSITTQAVLREQESLLIGGLFREEKSTTESRIPILGKLPAIGGLFRTEEHNSSRVERLILIEPRIVALPPCGPEPHQPGALPPGGLQTGTFQPGPFSSGSIPSGASTGAPGWPPAEQVAPGVPHPSTQQPPPQRPPQDHQQDAPLPPNRGQEYRQYPERNPPTQQLPVAPLPQGSPPAGQGPASNGRQPPQPQTSRYSEYVNPPPRTQSSGSAWSQLRRGQQR